MPDIIQAALYETGLLTVVAVRTRDSDGAYWNTGGTPAFEEYDAANIEDYAIAASEVGETGEYTVTDVADDAGVARFIVPAGGSLAVSDLVANVRATVGAGVSSVTLTSAERTTLAAAIWNALTSISWIAGSFGALLKQLTFTEENKVDATAVLSGSSPISVVVPSSVAAASAEVNLITAVRGDTLRRTFTGLGDLTDRSALWLTVKKSYDDADSDAIIQMTEAGGLLTFQGAPAADPSSGSLTVETEDDASLTIFLDEALGALLAPVGSGWVFDAQWRNGSTGDVTTILFGEFIVPPDVTRATS